MASKSASGKKNRSSSGSGAHSRSGSGSRSSSHASSGRASSARSSSAKTQAQGARRRTLSDTPAQQAPAPSRFKNDVTGILVIAIAVILMIAVCMDSDAFITSHVSMWMHYGFGVGAYILPVMVLVYGICFFLLNRYDMALGRIATGLVILFLGITSLVGVNAPGAENHLQALFADDYLLAYGGYVGNAIAYVLLSLIGFAISWVVLVAAMLGSLVLIGFSISGFFDWMFARRRERKRRNVSEQPYSRARANSGGSASLGRDGRGGDGVLHPSQGSPDAMGEGGFVPAGATVQLSDNGRAGSRAGKTRLLGGTRKTRTLASDEGPSAAGTVMLGGDGFDDWDDEVELAATPEEADLTADTADDASCGASSGDVADEAACAAALDGADDNASAASGVDAAEVDAAGDAAAEVDAAGVAAAATAAAAKAATPKAPSLLADTKKEEAEEGEFELPDPKFLKKSSLKPRSNASSNDLAEMGAKLQDTLHEFNVEADVVGWVHGPTVTLFKVSLASGVRVNKITALSDDIALAFASQSVRIFSPIAGTSLVGIEIPNDARESVLLGDVLPPAGEKPMLMAIGKDVEGNAITADLAKMPHLLIGGTTGSGKSVAINSMIMSVLMRAKPEEVRMILIDPKRVELSLYNDIPHLFVPVVTDPHKAASTLAWAVQEMERRLKLFEEVGARNISQYSKIRKEALEEQERRRSEIAERIAEIEGQRDDEGMLDPELLAELAELEDEEFDEWEQMPSMMIVIDELADLMMVAGKEVETSISRIAQLARAAGIHMIVATQRPSTNVITGLIKANITNRIAFNVASGVDSRVILDSTGAEHLIGLGDLLISKPEYGKPLRVQGCFVGEDEINKVCKFLREQAKPDYHEDIFATSVPLLENGGMSGNGGSGSDDDLLWEAAEIVVSSNLGSTSALQRRLKVGYARAGRIMDMLEDKGIVGPANGSKPREVYVDQMELENLKAMAGNGML